MVRHIVVWRLNEVCDKAKTAALIKEKLEALKDKIDELVDIQVGININDTISSSDLVLVSTFKTMDDLKAYIIHPEHKAVGSEYVRPNVSERRSVDYEF